MRTNQEPDNADTPRAISTQEPEARSLKAFLEKNFPLFGFFGLGFWLAWDFIIVRSGLWLSQTETTGEILSDLNIWISLVSCVVLTLITLFSESAWLNRVLDQARLPRLAGLLGSVSGLLLIAGGPLLLGSAGADVIYYLLYVVFALCGIASSLFVVGYGRMFLRLSPMSNLIVLFACEFIVASTYYAVDSLDFYTPVSGAPGYAVIFAVSCLPLISAWMLHLAQDAKNVDEELPNNDDGIESGERLPLRSLGRYILVLLVFAFIASVPRNLFVNAQSPELITATSSLVLLARIAFAVIVLVATFRIARNVPVERIFAVVMVTLPLLLAITPLFANGSTLFQTGVDFCFDELSMSGWFLTCMLARQWRASAIRIICLSRTVILLGSVGGWLFGLNVMPIVSSHPAGNMVYCWFALAALAALLLFFFNGDKRVLSALSFNAEDSLVFLLGRVRTNDAAPSKQDQTRPWHTACRKVAEQNKLTPRESEIMEFLSKGRTMESIAEELCISTNTVRTHVNNLYAKCNVHSREELAKLIRANSDKTKSD